MDSAPPIDFYPMMPFMQPQGRPAQNPLPTPAATAQSAPHAFSQARPSGPLQELLGDLNSAPQKASTASRLGAHFKRGDSFERTLKNAARGDVAKVRDGRKALLERVANHRGIVMIYGNDELPAYAFERDEESGEWRGFSGINGEPLPPEQSSPDKVLAILMGPPQNTSFKAYAFVDWRPAGGEGRERHEAAASDVSMSGARQRDPQADSMYDVSPHGTARRAGEESPVSSPSISSVSLPDHRSASRRSVHTIEEDGEGEAVPSQAPLVLTPDPETETPHQEPQ